MNLDKINDLKKLAQTALAQNINLKDPIRFFSTTASLIVGISAGQMMRDQASGSPIRVGQKIVEFNAMGNGIKRADGSIQKFGYLITNDPETALKLLERAERPDTDILLDDDYLKMVTPPEIQIQSLETRAITAENELERLIAENTKLQAALAAAETAPGRKKAEATA